jgi:hypothetical protein
MKLFCKHFWKVTRIEPLRTEGNQFIYAEYSTCIKCKKERIKERGVEEHWLYLLDRKAWWLNG